MAEVYAIAAQMRPWYRALVLMAAFTSLRWGELIALRRRDLDLDDGFVRVRAAVVEIDSKLDGGRPKWLAGVREVGIPEVLQRMGPHRTMTGAVVAQHTASW